MPRIQRSARQRAWWPFGRAKASPAACKTSADCPSAAFCCDTTADPGVCIRRNHPKAKRRCPDFDAAAVVAPPAPAPAPAPARAAAVEPEGRFAAIEGEPGSEGFNRAVGRALAALKLPRTMGCDPVVGPDGRRRPQDQFHQRVLTAIVHPDSPINRLLVVWTPGLGKTLAMIRILDNFFRDRRARLILFPTQALVDNFYAELCRFDNRYIRHFMAFENIRENPFWIDDAAVLDKDRAALEQKRLGFRRRVEAFLKRWPVPVAGAPASGMTAPLRAYGFLDAGAQRFGEDETVFHWRGGKGKAPRRAAVDAHGKKRLDAFDGMVVLVDEAHNVAFPGPSLGAADAAKPLMDRLFERLYDAYGTTLALLTATPVLNGATAKEEAERMLWLTKGRAYEDRGDEGFVSWYVDRPPALFARTQPSRLTDIVRDGGPHLCRVHIDRGVDDPRGPWLWQFYAHHRWPAAFPDPGKFRDLDGQIEKLKGTMHEKYVWNADLQTYQKRKAEKAPAAAAAPPKAKAIGKKKKASAKKKDAAAVVGAKIPAPKPKAKKRSKKKKTPAAPAPGARPDARPDWFGYNAAPKAGHPGDACLKEGNCAATWSVFEHVWFDPDATDEARAIVDAGLTLRNAADLCPKLAAIAESAARRPVKTLVLVHQAYGPLVLWHLLRLHGIPAILLRRPGAAAKGAPAVDPLTDGKRTRENLAAFNAADNLEGQRYRVAVAVVEEFGEGVSFIGVRRIVLASLAGPLEVPRWPLAQQWISRALRMCSHHALPKAADRTLDVDLFVAQHGRSHRCARTVDEQRLEFLRTEMAAVDRGMELLRAVAVDADLHAPRRSWLPSVFKR